MISGPFIRRPIGTSLLALALFLAGSAAYYNLPVAPLPRVDMPTIQVSGALPGASPETMASSVATPLERRFGRIAGVTEVTSTSSLGATSLTLQFDLDRDVDAAARDVQAAINAAGGELPVNLPSRPNYRKVNPADAPILILALRSDALPLGEVFDLANTILAQKISQVDGVGQVFVGGGQQPAVRVAVDPAALNGAGLTLEDVRQSLAQANVNQAKGVLQGSEVAYALAASDQITRAADYAPLLLRYQNASALRLRDVADVTDSVENDRLAAWLNDDRAVLMIIRRQPGANIIDTIDRVKRVLPDLMSFVSPSVKVDVAMDRATTIRASVRDVETSLCLSILLVVLVVLMFLRSLRATAIPSVAVPLSLVGTFGAMYLLGYSLDNLSLMALTISTGFVVDDAIVVTENISRFIEEGVDPVTAALRGAKQIGFTIVSITLSLLAVFLPILAMGGIVGRLFREFAVTLSVAVALSAVLSLTLTPMMCAAFLRHVPAGSGGVLATAFERGFDFLQSTYSRGLRWTLLHRRFMLLMTIVTFVINVAMFIAVPKGLFPQQDTGVIMGFSEAAQDVSFLTMKKHAEAANAVVLKDPDVNHMVSFIGAANGSTGNTGTMFIDLKPKEHRSASADAIINRLRGPLSQLTGVKLFLQASQDVRMGGRSSRTQYQYTLQDADLAELNAWAPKLLARLQKIDVLKDVASDQQTAGVQLDIKVDRDAAARLGVTVQDIDNTLYDAFGQRQVSTFYTERNEYRVIMEVKRSFQQGMEALERLYVPGRNRVPVPLASVASFSSSSTSLAVNHQSQFPAITVSFNLAKDKSLGQAVAAIEQAQAELMMPAGLIAGFQGTAQAFGASSKSEPMLILAALCVVYVVLGVLYESFVHPLTILSTLPSAGIGALLALYLCRMEFSIIALIGIILLIGIVKKNAIMMIDFALEAEREAGMTAEKAIYKACILRFRPIMMTTLAALLGGLPLAFGRGEGAEIRQPLGVTIVGGLMVSQLLTLFTTPVVYLALDRLTTKCYERAAKGARTLERAR